MPETILAETAPPAEIADAITRSILIRAPRDRVWRALTDAREFGAWFGAELSGAFVPGGRVEGRLTICKYEHVRFAAEIVAVEPKTRLAYAWHPYAVDPAIDYARETPTLVEFFLDDAAEGILLRVVESGFSRLPAQRRAEAFRMNSGGWTHQMENIKRHAETPA